MDRAYEANPASGPPSPPSPALLGYPTETNPATEPGAWWFYMITEELRAAIVAAGMAPSATVVNQLATAIQTIAESVSNAAAYLKLAGGTLTGALGGTTANFSGQVTAASFNVSSDERLKKDIAPIEDALARLELLRGVTFTWRENGEAAAGVIAQEAAKAIPQGVRIVDGVMRVDPMALIGVLLEGLREERDARRALEARIAALEAR